MALRRTKTTTPPRPRDEAELTALRAGIDQALAVVTDAMRANAANRPLVDVCLDVRNALRGRPA